MFVSLNKKFIYTIFIFFIITSLIFLYSFYLTYGIRFQDDLKANIVRNQQYINLLYENNLMKKEFIKLSQKHSDIKLPQEISVNDSSSLEKTISKEKQRILQLQKSYDDRYTSVYEGIKFVAASSVLIILSLLLLWFLLKRWVIIPLRTLADVSKNVAEGNLSQRAQPYKQRYFLDETDFLIDTFNNMLDELGASIFVCLNRIHYHTNVPKLLDPLSRLNRSRKAH